MYRLITAGCVLAFSGSCCRSLWRAALHLITFRHAHAIAGLEGDGAWSSPRAIAGLEGMVHGRVRVVGGERRTGVRFDPFCLGTARVWSLERETGPRPVSSDEWTLSAGTEPEYPASKAPFAQPGGTA
jgi:hypothetical protein